MDSISSTNKKTIKINGWEFQVKRIFPKHGYLSYEIKSTTGGKDHFLMIMVEYNNFRIIQKTKISDEILSMEHHLSFALNNIDSEQTDYQYE
jgi:hypothetical protein